jgi:sigma-E factor negative regulatory protein RseC
LGELRNPGRVISTNGVIARIQMKRMGACSGQHDGCPWNALAENIFKEDIFIDAKNLIGAKPGDNVEVAISSNIFNKAVFLVYLVPLVGLFVGCFFGFIMAILFSLPGYRDVFSGTFMVIGLIICLFITKNRSKHYNPDYTITRIINTDIRSYSVELCNRGKI